MLTHRSRPPLSLRSYSVYATPPPPPACFSCSRPASRIAGRLAAGTAASPPSQRRGRRHGRCGSRSGRRRPGRRRSLLSRTQQGPPPPSLWQVERVGGLAGEWEAQVKGGGARAEGRRRAPRERGEASGSSGGSLVAGHWRLGRWRPVVPGSAGSAETPPRQQPQLGRGGCWGVGRCGCRTELRASTPSGGPPATRPLPPLPRLPFPLRLRPPLPPSLPPLQAFSR